MHYSIIIPHKNTPELLIRLLNSIPLRDDCEVIIVDDNSSKDLVDFSNFPGRDRNDVKIILLDKSCGAGHARNEGLKHACGDWVYFVDADDVLSKEVNNLFDKYKNITNIDMVFLNAMSFNEFGQFSKLPIEKYINNYIKGKKDSLNILRYNCWTPWSRLIRRKILIDNNVKFEEVPVGNDIMGILNASLHSTSFSVEKSPIYYYYRPTEGSQTTKAHKSAYVSRYDLRYRINEFYRKVGHRYYWPQTYRFNDKRLNKSPEIQNINHKYGFTWRSELKKYCNYFFYRIIGRI